MNKVSFYFSAGDFYEAINRFDNNLPQLYQTHDEIVKLAKELSQQKIQITIFSTVTLTRQTRRYGNTITIVDLGEKDFISTEMLVKSVREFPADAIVANYAKWQLLKASLSTKSRVFPILAETDNRSGAYAWMRRRRNCYWLNNPRFDLVANHGMPATRQLASFGVKREKLVAWDIDRPFHPDRRPAKPLRERGPFEIFYAGSVIEAKGVGDLIRALPLVLGAGVDVRCVVAGSGAVESMRTLAGSLGVEDKVTFLGVVSNLDVQGRMASADVVVVPSRAEFPEGFPLTMFEAVASRTPIACSDHPVFRDLFVNDRDAVIFKGGDSASLARALVGLLRDGALYFRLSTNAEATWKLFAGPADWRTLIKTWIFEGSKAPWIQKHVLSNL